ncbi:unnamed protein product [Prunus armeniaca]|uniref:Uncharacterized protein n=1 Tax=Prunus armeniaca TaxID=36596 RepID=A0A6J5XLR4_PRUAR|nr:unnamed protein product [Prunus armeniaca]
MGEVQKGFDEILTLTAEEADALVIEEEDDGVSQDILERSLVAKLYSPKLVHNKSFKNRMLEIWDPVGETSSLEVSNKVQAVSSQLQSMNARRLRVKELSRECSKGKEMVHLTSYSLSSQRISRGSEQRDRNWENNALTEAKKISEGIVQPPLFPQEAENPNCQAGEKKKEICAISHSEVDKALFGDFEVRQSGWQRAKECAGQNKEKLEKITSNMLIGEKRKGEPVMEGEASKHRRVDDGKNTEIVMYESVVGSEMLAHHEQ